MGEHSKIQWTDHTFNPWIGCQRLSPGCVNCYAEHRNAFVRIQRKQGRELWGPRGDRHVTSESNWSKPLAWNRAAEAAGRHALVFCASLSDWAEDRRDLDAPRARLYNVVESTPWLYWQLLTKRIDRVMDLVPAHWQSSFPPNVWIGTSVEDQRRAEERIPHLLDVPARVRFLSCEPLLEEVDITPWLWGRDIPCAGCPKNADCNCGFSTRADLGLPSLHWVIIGGESGTGARAFNVGWASSLIGQCANAEVRCFVKQLGAHVIDRNDAGFSDDGAEGGWPGFPETSDLPGYQGWQGVPVRVLLRDLHGGDWDEWPERFRSRAFPDIMSERGG